MSLFLSWRKHQAEMFSAQEDHYSGAALCAYRRLLLDKIATPKVFGAATAGAHYLATTCRSCGKPTFKIDISFTHISSHAPFPMSVRRSELLQELIPGPLASTRSPLKWTRLPMGNDLHRAAIEDDEGMMWTLVL
jgi:hypothetical protein